MRKPTNPISIPDWIASPDVSELAKRYQQRYTRDVHRPHVEVVVRIATHPDGPSVGGTGESPWSDETWLNWIHNRLIDLESQSVAKVLDRFIKPRSSITLDDETAWREFLDKYVKTATRVACSESWSLSGGRFVANPPATESEVRATELRLGVQLPHSLRTFYRVANGWPEDGWINPAINPLSSLNYLVDHDPDLYRLATDAENTEGPWKDDPDGRRLNEYRFEQGTRVKRSIALSFNTNDTATILVDPWMPQDDGEWPCGSWAHWNPAMEWSHKSFADYMRARYEALTEMEDGI